jgi:hypothetical protein
MRPAHGATVDPARPDVASLVSNADPLGELHDSDSEGGSVGVLDHRRVAPPVLAASPHDRRLGGWCPAYVTQTRRTLPGSAAIATCSVSGVSGWAKCGGRASGGQAPSGPAPLIAGATRLKSFAVFGVFNATRGLASVPGRVLSRLNISNSGWAHVLQRHFPGGTGSQFNIAQGELRTLLGSRQVVGSPVVRTLESADGVRYLREVDIGRTIGFDKFAGADTSILSVTSDKFGNLITAFPGVLK